MNRKLWLLATLAVAWAAGQIGYIIGWDERDNACGFGD